MLHFFKRKAFHFILFIHLVTISVASIGQTSKQIQKHFNKALIYFKADNFEMAIKETENVLEHDITFVDAYLLLADIFQETDSVNLEIKSLETAALYSNKPAILYRLGEAAYSIGKYEKALKNYNLYLQTESISEERKMEVQRKTESCDFAIYSINHPVEFHPLILSTKINSIASEYWPSISLDQKKLVFTRLIKDNGRMAQEDFYFSDLENGNWSEAKPITDINTGQNEGAQILSADGKLLFFTACNRPDGKGSCDIYYSRFENNKWSVAKNAGSNVNTGSWEAQPGFSSDNRYLYFSSSRPGGKGAKDIWRAEFLGIDDFGNLIWGQAENLGENINTPGDEISPFIHPNNKNFYFVSDYLIGMGGFDLFSSVQNRSTFSPAKNMGYPINTYKNELGLHIAGDGKTAYFSSERGTNTGLDIYQFQLSNDLQPDPVTYVNTKVIDAKTKKPVVAQVDLIDLSIRQLVRTEKADKNGELLLCLPVGVNYAFNVSEDGYLFFSETFQLSDKKTLYEPYNFNIELQPIELGAEMNLYNIYFEVDSFSILPESVPELNQLVLFLKNNRTLDVEIQGNTDSSGSFGNNQQLSEKRAKSVVNYLVENGIEKTRLQSKGFGQQKPVATNETEEGRRLNRRTTVKIGGSSN